MVARESFVVQVNDGDLAESLLVPARDKDNLEPASNQLLVQPQHSWNGRALSLICPCPESCALEWIAPGNSFIIFI